MKQLSLKQKIEIGAQGYYDILFINKPDEWVAAFNAFSFVAENLLLNKDEKDQNQLELDLELK